MIEDIKKGKYDAILAWHPDRLARNMLEGGMIIDLIDRGILKDLKFVTHHFSQDANGKMLLGMAFVLSKQYSDKLSQDVTRGVRRDLARGKSSAFKHGYYRAEDEYYRPDSNTFVLMCEAWEKRNKGEPIDSISDWLNTQGYVRTTKEGKKQYMSKQKLSTIFQDPFYYGVLVQNGKQIDLREIFDFEPQVSEDTFNKIQYESGHKPQPYKSKGLFLPLKGLIFCHYCQHQMYAGTSQSGSIKKKNLNYSCRNKYCVEHSYENKNRSSSDPMKLSSSVRGKVNFDFINDLLENGLNFTDAEYQSYIDSLHEADTINIDKVTLTILSLEGQQKHLLGEKRRLAIALPKLDQKTDIYTINAAEFEKVSDELVILKADIAKQKSMLSDPNEKLLTYEEFFKLSKNAAQTIKAGTAVQKDAIVRFIFSNCIIENKKVASYQLKEPFSTLLKNRSVLNGRGDWTRTSDHSHPMRAF
jgi:hypothetical protein